MTSEGHPRVPGLQADTGSEHERILFGLPVVLDTADDSVAIGDTLLLQYQVSKCMARCAVGCEGNCGGHWQLASDPCDLHGSNTNAPCAAPQGQDLAVMTVNSKWAPNKPKEAKHCYGTTSIEHPGVSMISMERGKYYLGEQCFVGLNTVNFSKHTLMLQEEWLLATAVVQLSPHLACQADRRCHAAPGGDIKGLALPKRVFPCATPAEVQGYRAYV
jgi:PUA-like domain